jgi:hypothetical protein
MQWRKSSRSTSNGNCVEVRRDLAAIRDSKAPSAALAVPGSAVRGLVAWLR